MEPPPKYNSKPYEPHSHCFIYLNVVLIIQLILSKKPYQPNYYCCIILSNEKMWKKVLQIILASLFTPPPFRTMTIGNNSFQKMA